jgi:hypothetical protein
MWIISEGIWDTHFYIEYAGGIHNYIEKMQAVHRILLIICKCMVNTILQRICSGIHSSKENLKKICQKSCAYRENTQRDFSNC